MKKEVSYDNRKVIVERKTKTKKPQYKSVSKKEGETGIYAVECEKTRSVYIGQSKNIPVRFRSHRYSLRRGDYLNRYPGWQSDFDELGEANFKFNIIKHCEEDKLLYWETFYIKNYKNTKWSIYNIQHITCNKDALISCPIKYEKLIERLVSQLEKGKLKPEHLEQALNHNEFC